MTTEIEGEVIDVGGRELAVVPTPAPAQSLIVGGAALASMSDADFEANLVAMRRGIDRVRRIMETALVEGEDYGRIPGVKRAFLYKSGAEILGRLVGYAASFRIERVVGDGVTAPPLAILAYAEIHLADTRGSVVAEGVGEANSWETKYRYRRGERACPDCGATAIIKGKAEYGGGWVCFKKRGGCGAKWPDGAAIIEGQQIGDVENPDPWDLANTLAKMAKKRAFVDGILTATATSGLFTQDEDSPPVQPAAGSAAEPAFTKPAPGFGGTPQTIGGRDAADGGPTAQADGPAAPSAPDAPPVQSSMEEIVAEALDPLTHEEFLARCRAVPIGRARIEAQARRLGLPASGWSDEDRGRLWAALA